MSCLGHMSAVFIEGVNVRPYCSFFVILCLLYVHFFLVILILCNLLIFINFGFSCLHPDCCANRHLHIGDASYLIYLNICAVQPFGHKSGSDLSFPHNFTSILLWVA